MEPNQPASSTTFSSRPASPGLFGGKTPSSVAFAVGILLFLLPFAELRCVGTKIATKSGLDYALANEWKPITGGMMNKSKFQEKAMDFGKEQKGNTQYLAIGAAALGLLGLLLSLGSAKTGGAGGLVTGVLAGGALIGLMIDAKKNYAASLRNQALNKVTEKADDMGYDKVGNTMDDAQMSLAFSPWFYLAIVAFLAAAFFCYRRMSEANKR